MRAVMRLRGSSKFVGVASVLFRFSFRLFLNLLAPTWILFILKMVVSYM